VGRQLAVVTTPAGGVLPANTAQFDRSSSSGGPSFLRTPKGQVLVIFVILLAVAAPGEDVLGLVPHLASAILAACAVDVLCTYWRTQRWVVPTSALLTGLIVAGILGPQEPITITALVGGLASVGKHVLRNRREHFFNPAALALLASSVVFGSGQSWWGALGNAPWPLVGVLLVTGVFICDRLNKFPVVLSFLGAYFAALTLISLIDASSVAEMFRSPFVQAALFLAFFMLTDPPTSPNRLPEQVWYGLIAAGVAVVAQLLGAGQVYLLLGVLAANVWLAVYRWLARRPPPMTPQQRRRARIAQLNSRRAVPLRVPARSLQHR